MNARPRSRQLWARPPHTTENTQTRCSARSAPAGGGEVESSRGQRQSGQEKVITMQVNWRKSSHSFSNSNCVQVAARQTPQGTEHLVRDSKDPAGPVLVFSPAVWDAFLREVKKDPTP
jgi:Domain of unknown function (DUF397)